MVTWVRNFGAKSVTKNCQNYHFSISRRIYSKPFKVEIAVAVVIFVYSSDVDTILLDILGKYHPDSDQPDAQTLREFVDNLQESKYSFFKQLKQSAIS